MKENLQKFGEVAVFIFLALLFLFTGYVSWGHGTPETASWCMPAVSVASLGWGVWLLYMSMAEIHRLRSSNKSLGTLFDK